MATEDDLEADVDSVFRMAFEEREGRKVPATGDVALSNGAVKIEAAFLYADLAGSAGIAATCPWKTTAKIIRAYLKCATRLMRLHGGEIRSFDGDRVMGVFMGDTMCTDAVTCALKIHWATEHVIQEKARKTFSSVRDNDVEIQQACGIDVGTARAVRAGIRNNNDLVWIGRAPSLSAKLSDAREFPYCTFITSAVLRELDEGLVRAGERSMWEERSFDFAGRQERVHRSDFWCLP